MAKVFLTITKLIIFGALLYVRAEEMQWNDIFRNWGYQYPFVFEINKVLFSSAGAGFSDFSRHLLNFFIFVLGINLLVVMFSFIYRKRRRIAPDKTNNVLSGLENIYILLMTAAVILTALTLTGIDTKSLFTGLSIVAAAIAIITKDYIANIISGIAISFSDEISIGDYVQIGDHKGRVTDISISRISLLNDDDDLIFIPNNTVFISEIINYTKRGIRKVNIEFEMNLNYLNTVDELEAHLIESLHDFQDHIEANTFRLKTEEIFKDSVKMKFQFVLRQVNREMEREIRKKTVRQVVNHLRRDGVGHHEEAEDERGAPPREQPKAGWSPNRPSQSSKVF